MALKKTKIIAFLIAFAWVFTMFAGSTVHAEEEESKQLLIADSPSECLSKKDQETGKQITPINCLFLEEPIGGKPGYDLFLVTCVEGDCTYALWRGGRIPDNARGPIQAILTRDPDKPYQGPFGLLYNYLGLVYAYMSGLIVGIAVLFVVIGGIQMTTAGGDSTKFDAGKSRIVKAVVGMILWFTASLILYTINPTFFAF